MKNMKRILSAAAVFVLAGSMLPGCGSSSSDENTLVMATNATFPPYEYVEGDEIVGIDPEIAAAIAEELGMDHETAYRLAAHFGGGMRRQATCGAVTGALMALGLLGRGEEPIAVDFQERFRREAGSLDCGDLVQAALDRGEEKKPSCDRLIALAVDMVEDFAREA